MIAQEQHHPKRTWLIVSLLLHGFVIVGLLTSLLEKNLNDASLFNMSLQKKRQAAPVITADKKQKSEEEKEEATKKRQRIPLPSNQKTPPERNEKPFTVPAPVVFYGNQAMMNLPTPIAGHPDGKSSFDSNPSALPTPSTPTIAAERLSAPPSVPTKDTQDTQEEQTTTLPPTSELAPALQPIQKPLKQPTKKKVEQEQKESLEVVPVPTTLTSEPEPKKEEPIEKMLIETTEITPPFTETPPTAHIQTPALMNSTNNRLDPHATLGTTIVKQKKAAKKQLTLADLFRNAPTALTAISQAGEPSAKKAGTEGGDVHGSGHQITIKEGDMKYYTLWAKFLNHLNQAARFNRRGKEHRIIELAQRRDITYVLQCGITVDKRGKLLDIEIIHSSGSKEFDKFCISDIKYAVPYPPLPETLNKKSVRFEVNVYP